MTITVGDAAAWVAIVFIGLLGAIIIFLVATERIDLSRLISEPTGDASLSRFQLLIFTFVVALSLLIVVVSAKPEPRFPETIPSGILVLLGISASSYLVSKSIQFSRTEGVEEKAAAISVTPNRAEAGPGQTVRFSAQVTRVDDDTVRWGIVPPGVGSIDAASGVYTAPMDIPAGTAIVTIEAVSVEDPSAVATALVTLIQKKG